MKLSFGKYQNKDIAWVLIEQPDYLKFMFQMKNRDAELSFINSLIQKLNSLPFQEKCCFEHCSNVASRLSLYNLNSHCIFLFCSDCDPYDLGASDGKLTYLTSLNVKDLSDSELVKKFYAAKGGPKRKTTTALKTFFDY